MIHPIVRFSIQNRFFVLIAAVLLVGAGVWSAVSLPIDAVPDVTNKQVQINTTAPALAPEEVERQITFPVEYALGGLKGLEEVRSISRFGLSQVIATFSDDTDIYFARQQINERLGEVELARCVLVQRTPIHRSAEHLDLPFTPHESAQHQAHVGCPL